MTITGPEFSARKIQDKPPKWEIFDEDGDFILHLYNESVTDEMLEVFEIGWKEGYVTGKFDGMGRMQAIMLNKQQEETHNETGTEYCDLGEAGTPA